jgi:hypothetical protein
MNITQAKIEGVKAFRAGQGRAPALNGAFMNAMHNDTVEGINAMLDAYLHGFDIASLAKDAPLPNMPSVLELARIERAAMLDALNAALDQVDAERAEGIEEPEWAALARDAVALTAE